MTSHGQCPRGGGCLCFSIFRRADDVTRTMSKGGCLRMSKGGGVSAKGGGGLWMCVCAYIDLYIYIYIYIYMENICMSWMDRRPISHWFQLGSQSPPPQKKSFQRGVGGGVEEWSILIHAK